MKIVGGMATFPERQWKSLGDAIRSIIGQLDVLHLYLNEYESVPKWLYRFENVIVHHGASLLGDLKDIGKFYGLSQEDGVFVYVCLDDDGIYPSDYVERMLAGLNSLEQSCFVCSHMDIFEDDTPVKDFFKPKRRVLSSIETTEIEFGHTPGTGAMVFKSDLVNVEDILNCDAKYIGRSDLLITALCQKHKIPVASIPHPKRWCLNNKKINGGVKRIYDISRADKKNNALINDIYTEYGLRAYRCGIK